jgi:DNA-binding transcriptional ArsR family regulator
LELRAKFFRGLADASRLALLIALREGEKTVGALVDETALTQSNVSGHLACLKDCGLVISRQEWRHVYYRLSDERIEGLLSAADDILTISADRISRCVNYCVDGTKERV